MSSIKIPQFKIRCSAIGDIMTDPREKSKAGQLSQTTISYLEDWVKEHIYGTRKEFRSKYTDKGNVMENPSIAFAAQYYGWGLIEKNDTHKEDEYFTGTCDVFLKGIKQVNDIKNSYDCFSFPLFKKEIPDKAYMFQVQGYARLYDCETMNVVYTLMNMPDEIIVKECYIKHGTYFTKEDFEGMREKHSYDHLPDNLRIKRYSFERSLIAEFAIIDRVKECREYIQENIITQL